MPYLDLTVGEVLVADVVDERDNAAAVAGVVVARAGPARPAAWPASRRGAAAMLKTCASRGYITASNCCARYWRLRVGQLDAVVVAAVAGGELEILRDGVLVARHPDLDVRADRAQREVLEVLPGVLTASSAGQRRRSPTTAAPAFGAARLRADLGARQRRGLELREFLARGLDEDVAGSAAARPAGARLRSEHGEGREGEEGERATRPGSCASIVRGDQEPSQW